MSESLFLMDWDRLNIQLSWAYEGVVSPDYREETSPHFGQSVFLMREGQVLVSTPKGTARGKAGDWIFPVQGKRHQRFSEQAKLLSIHMNFEWPGGVPFFDWDPALVIGAKRFPHWEQLANPLVHFIDTTFGEVRWGLRHKSSDILTWRRMQRLFFDWFDAVLADLTALGNRPERLVRLDSRLQAGLEFLKNQSFRSPFQERDVAAYAGLSVRQWNRLFQKEIGITPRAFYDQRRLEGALEMVRGGSPFKEIAFELGFSSLAHFSAWFHRKTGATPTSSRQRSATAE